MLIQISKRKQEYMVYGHIYVLNDIELTECIYIYIYIYIYMHEIHTHIYIIYNIYNIYNIHIHL